MKMNRYAAALFFFAGQMLFPQISLQNEGIVQNRYRLDFSVDQLPPRPLPAAAELNDDGTNAVHDSPPAFRLHIALPPNSNPASTFTLLQPYQARPNEDPSAGGPAPWYSVKGFLWIGNTYCMEVEIQPFVKGSGNAFTRIIDEFRIEFDLGPGLAAPAKVQMHTTEIPEAVTNKKFAQRWISARPHLSVPATDSWIDYSKEYLKFGVVKDAIYRLSYPTLKNYGIPVTTLNPGSLKIFKKGKEIPIYVRGEQDNVFDSTDYVEFFGHRNYGAEKYRENVPFNSAFNEYLDLYSDTTVYWLQWTGPSGLRIDTILIQSGLAADTTRYYDHLLHQERDVFYAAVLDGGDLRMNMPEIMENETWFEGNLSVGKFSQGFTVSELAANKPARAFAKVLSLSSNITTNAHNFALSINNTAAKYDSGFSNKNVTKVLKAEFSSSVLVNGSNTVDVHSFATQNSINTAGRDWYELEYPRNLRTTNDSLDFGYRNVATPKYTMIAIRGVTASSISLYKFSITDSSAVKITNYKKSNDTIYFADTVRTGIRYYLLANSKILTPLIYYKKKFQNLRSSARQSDYIAIAPPAFLSLANNYASFIASAYTITSVVVDVNDIYDEYNYGFFSPLPIKEFLKSTHQYWQAPKPAHVFLIGKGTYDYYGNRTRYAGVPKTINHIPPMGNPVSDNLFVMWDSTGSLVPQMNIGRLPARNIDEFQMYFSKHQKYVSKGFDDWNKQYIFFSGGNFNDLNQLAQSKGVNDFIINNYVNPSPIGGNSINFYKTPAPNITNFGPYPPEYIKNSIDNGAVFISYIGHSGTQTWDNSITDISQLANIRDRNPMISDFGCSTAKFAEPDIYSFSELAVSNIKGQAISYIGNSSLGFTSTAYTFPQVFYRTLLIDTSISLGNVHRLAKISYMKQYGSSGSYGLFVKTNSLIGDPIVKLPIPEKPNLSFTNSTVRVLPDRPTDQSDSIAVSVRYFNLGKVTKDSVDVSVRVERQGSLVMAKTFRKPMPKYLDSLTFSIPTKGRAGEYSISIVNDSAGTIDEIYENDNTIFYQTVVASTQIRNLAISAAFNQSSGSVTFLNPTLSSSSQKFIVDISLNSLFSPKTFFQVPYDSFFTNFRIDTAYYGKRIWMRSAFDSQNSDGLPYSYILGDKDNYLVNDSVAFFSVTKQQVKYAGTSLALDTTKTVFSALSGGFNDGNTAVLTKNGQNYIPENTLRGFHLCLFDAESYEFKGYFLFDIQASATVGNNFKNFLDTLSPNYLLLIAIANDVSSNASLFTTAIKTSIKQYGSKFIDTIRLADSWALIGKKGAVPGSVPEKFSKRFVSGSPIGVDSTILIPHKKGSFTTQPIGPVAEWKSVESQYGTPMGSSVSMGVIGIKKDGSADTLIHKAPVNPQKDISSIDAAQYPSITLFGELSAGLGNQSPSLSSVAVNYSALPELGTNYQVFKGYHVVNNVQGAEIGSTDSVLQGSKVLFKYRIYNAGGSTAKNVVYTLTSNWENNYKELITSATVDSISPQSYREFSTQYSTSLGSGKRTIQLSIDPDTAVSEIYKDNNFYTYPLVIKKSAGNPLLPNLSIAQNAVVSDPVQITDEIDTARFTIVYANTGSLSNDSVSIQIRHYFQSDLLTTTLVRRRYPVSYDTVRLNVPVLKNAGEHQIMVELDYTGLILESSEEDNITTHYFTVATTDFKVLSPAPASIAFADRIVFLNPTVGSGPGSIVSLQIDTVSSFSSPQSFLKPIQQFATSFPLPGLKKSKRYFWRVKIQNSVRDWTTGSFYSGDSAVQALGQIDSVAWKNNKYSRAAFRADSGARIVDSKFVLTANSAGFDDGNNGSVFVNGVNVVTPILGSGHNLVVLDSVSFTVSALRRFDLAADAAQGDSLIQFIAAIPSGTTVIDVVVDEGSNNLQPAAKNALKAIGSNSIDLLSFRDSWAIIGRKGAAPGTVPELYKPRNSGAASAETTVVRTERTGTIETPLIGPFTSLSDLRVNSSVPPGAQLKVQFIGLSSANVFDTLVTATNQTVIPLSAVNTKEYRNGKLLFTLTVPPSPSSFRKIRSAAAVNSPSVSSWSINASVSTELAVSAQSTAVDKDQVMEGETIQFSGMVFNVSTVKAESVLVQLKTNASGIDNILKQQRIVHIPAGDSAAFTFAYDTRGKRGNHAFTFEIDPLDSLSEQSKANNSVTIPYVVIADTMRPTVMVSFDGLPVLDGDFVGRNPEIRIRFADNNPSAVLPSDTSQFTLRLNNTAVPFISGTAELLPSTSPGKADIRWTPTLAEGENIIQISAKDVSDNFSDTILLNVNVSAEFNLYDVFNVPNPFSIGTQFTFNLVGPLPPDEVIIKIYTVTGRMIHEIRTEGKLTFNRIAWDGRDKDGDEIGNGIYFYKVIVKQGTTQIERISKLVKMR